MSEEANPSGNLGHSKANEAHIFASLSLGCEAAKKYNLSQKRADLSGESLCPALKANTEE